MWSLWLRLAPVKNGQTNLRRTAATRCRSSTIGHDTVDLGFDGLLAALHRKQTEVVVDVNTQRDHLPIKQSPPANGGTRHSKRQAGQHSRPTSDLAHRSRVETDELQLERHLVQGDLQTQARATRRAGESHLRTVAARQTQIQFEII